MMLLGQHLKKRGVSREAWVKSFGGSIPIQPESDLEKKVKPE